MSKEFLIVMFFFLSLGAFAQENSITTNDVPGKIKNSKNSIYASFGWHRVYYSNSTIHFKDNETGNYDFKLLKAKATDDPNFWVGKGVEAPQWSIRIGYFFNSSGDLGIEFSYDHTKYILQQGQNIRLRGTINGQAYDKDTIITSNFVQYEHTDGANYFMFSIVKRKNLLSHEHKRRFEMLLKACAGWVWPKTNSTILGNHRDDTYNIAGYLLGLESSLRYEVLKNLFAEFSLKGAYANYGNVLLYGEGKAEQHWFSLQTLYTLAYQFNVGKKK